MSHGYFFYKTKLVVAVSNDAKLSFLSVKVSFDLAMQPFLQLPLLIIKKIILHWIPFKNCKHNLYEILPSFEINQEKKQRNKGTTLDGVLGASSM